jgi:hypothetical protein
MTTFKVKFSKYFITGLLTGISIDDEISMPNLDSANEFIRYCHAHFEKPAVSLGGSEYVIFGSRIVIE